jgi:hypothetical protein
MLLSTADKCKTRQDEISNRHLQHSSRKMDVNTFHVTSGAGAVQLYSARNALL